MSKNRTFRLLSAIVAWALVVTMIVTMMPTSAFATEDQAVETAEASGNTAEVSAEDEDAEAIAEESEGTSTEESAEATAEESEGTSTKESAEATAEQSESTSTEESEAVSTEESAQASTEESAQASTEESAQASTEESAAASTEESAQASTEGSAQASTEGSAAASTEESAQASTEESAQASTEESAAASTEESAAAATEDAAAAATESAAAATTETAAVYKAGTLTYKGKDYVVTVKYDEDACLPEGAELAVSEIKEGTDQYASYLEQAQGVVDDDELVNDARFFDITILADGKEIEPKSPVSVEISFSEIEQTDNEDTQLLHYQDNDKVETVDDAEFSKSGDQSVDSVEFEADGFSVYGIIVKETLTGGVIASDGTPYKVTVTYGADAKIPSGAKLSVTEIADTSEEYKSYLEKTANELDTNVPYARFFDISILDADGNEVEPQAEVSVEIALDDDAVEAPGVDFTAVHFSKESTDLIPVEVDETVSFTADSFSVYGVAYTYTVDFYYTPVDETAEEGTEEGAEDNASTISYNMPGGTQMLLSELLSKLGIDESAADVVSVTSAAVEEGTTPLEERLTFTQQDGDWLITSLAPFEDWYYVTITMADGTQYVIGVTDAYTGRDGTTVDHIDIAVTATADITVPLAYGTYYDSEGNKILTVDIGTHLYASGYNYSIDITSSDLQAAEITATKGGEEYTNFTAGTSYSTSTGTDPDSGASIDQVRIGGRFNIGTSDDPVNYSVSVDKEFTLTLQYDVDGDGVLDTLYDSEGNVVTLTVTATLNASFNYWTEGNMCPPIRMNDSSIASWEAGNYINGSGMDFILGASSDTSTRVTAIEIIKYIVDESGQIISTSTSYDFDFDVYQDTTDPDVTAPAAWSGAYSGSVDYSGYTQLSDRTATTSTDGIGIVYDYDVGDPALVYIVEDEESIPETIEDADGNTLYYQETYIETEYAWRNDDGETHSNINQSDTYTAIPEVVGDYYSDDYEGDLRNTFLEFYVYNVYAPNTGDLTVSKTVVSEAAADADQEFTFTVTLSDTSISGTYGDMTFTDGVATVTLKGGESATATGLPTGITYKVAETEVDGFTTEKTGDTGTIVKDTPSTAAFTNTRETGGLEVSKTVVSAAAADADQEFTFTVTLGDTSISGTYGDMEFTDGVATVTLKGGETATAEGLPTGITYTVAETEVDGFTTEKTDDTGTITTGGDTASFTNTRETGDLEVSKTVVSAASADKDQEFTFTVTLSDTSISGTYGDMEFTDGVATVTLKGGESATATDLPTGITYTVAETEVDGFTTEKTGDEGTITTGGATASFTNTRETGDLEVSKTVVSDAAADADAQFTFTVTLSDTTISGTYGDMNFENGVATVTLKGGESATAEDLPTGITYTVTEAETEGFTTTEKTGDEGTITTGGATASFTNTRETGDLEVSKTVVSDAAADKDQEFTFTVTLSDTSISGTYGDMTFENGVATFTLKGGESATAEDLPTGVTYTVEETAADGFTTEYDSNSGTISTTKSTSAYTNTRVTSGLVINKTVVSDAAADKDQEFTFTVTLSDTSISGTYGEMTFENGVATVTLKGGESATATGLPTGITYTVAETEVDGFTTEKTGDEGTISEGDAATAAFTNTRETGDLKVSKTVVSDAAADVNQEFTFTVTLSDTSINGTYGGMTFTDGVATVVLKDGETATAEGLPTGITYTVAETEVDGFTTEKTGDTGTISTETSTAAFTNTRETGDLTVNKVVVSDATADKDKEFTITVTLDDTGISGTYGDMTFTDGVATLTLKGSESATAEDLPTGIGYKVVETTADGFITTYSGETGTISTTAATATVMNTRETGDLTVEKVVVSDATADADVEFTITVTLYDTGISGTYGDMTFTDGVATLTLKGGDSATAEDLPTEIGYTVVESTDDGFTTTYSGETGTISTTAATATVTNTRKTGDLEITKTVVSSTSSDKTKEFTFTVTLDDTGISGDYGDLTFTDGVAVIELKDGETARAEGLPVGIGYTVEETADGFVTTYTGAAGSISTTAAAAAFTNTRVEGGLAVTKSVVSDLSADKEQKFSFTVTLDDTSISGTYGDMTFTDGVAEFELADGEAATAEDLPAGLGYTVTEETADGFVTTYTGDTGTISEEEVSVAAVTNTRETGDLTVEKVVESDAAADAAKAFTITVTLDENISGEYGDMTFTDGVATLTLKGGESATATDLPTGIGYTVVETTADGFTTTYSGETGTISTTAATATVTNTRETGDLEISKTVVSDLEEDKEQEFTFTVTLSDASINGTYGDMTFTDGVATVVLKDGETAAATGLPTGITYTVTEAEADGFTTTSEGDTGTISTEKSTAAFTNTKESEEETGDLAVTKTVESDDDSDKELEFVFTVILSDDTINGTYGDMTFTDGSASFTLKDGEKAVAEGLPIGISYTVAEDAADGFTTTAEGDTGTITEGTSTAAFTNTREGDEETTTYTVIKVWDDKDDKAGIRPDSVKVQLYADGEEYGDVIELTESDDWKYTWTGLAKYDDDGELISYTVKEIEVPKGYKVSYDEDDGVTTITNKHRKSPITGDTSNVMMWIALLLASLIGAGFLLFVRKRSRKDK